MALFFPSGEGVESGEAAERSSVLWVQLCTSIQAIAISCSQLQVRPWGYLNETNATNTHIDELTAGT